MGDERRPLLARPISLAPVWFLLPVIGAVFAAALEPIPPYDYWWPIVSGRLMHDIGAIPDANFFLYTLPKDTPFVNQPWLAQWVMYLAHDLHEVSNIVLRNLFLGLAWIIAMSTLLRRTGEARVAGILGVFAVMATFPVVSVRTRMFALVPFALLLAWLSLQASSHKFVGRRVFGLLCVATVFWANTHGSFVLAPVLTAIVGGGVVLENVIKQRAIPFKLLLIWGSAFAALTLLTFLNPQGPGIYAYVLQLAVTSNVSTTVSEWAPPDILEPIGVYFLVLLTAYLGIFWKNLSRVKIWEAALLLGVTYLGASAVRNLFWWSLVSAVVVAPHLKATLAKAFEETEVSPMHERLNVGILAFLLCLGAAVQPFVALQSISDLTTLGMSRREGGRGILSHENAVLATQVMVDREILRVFHDQAIGGLIEYKLTQSPQQVAFVDQRMELIPETIWSTYFSVSEAKLGWEETLNKYEVGGMVLALDGQTLLIQAAVRSPQWTLVALDESHVAFVRAGSLDATQ